MKMENESMKNTSKNRHVQHTNMRLSSKMKNSIDLFLLKDITHEVRFTNITLDDKHSITHMLI